MKIALESKVFAFTSNKITTNLREFVASLFMLTWATNPRVKTLGYTWLRPDLYGTACTNDVFDDWNILLCSIDKMQSKNSFFVDLCWLKIAFKNKIFGSFVLLT